MREAAMAAARESGQTARAINDRLARESVINSLAAGYIGK